ncbi:MAG: ABC transporter substrate-binding protein [Ectothiorhodospiraceae bacterium]|nr:ABC transporter substrate-binding protein [Ectothiorhodospiraceae bacterium]
MKNDWGGHVSRRRFLALSASAGAEAALPGWALGAAGQALHAGGRLAVLLPGDAPTVTMPLLAGLEAGLAPAGRDRSTLIPRYYGGSHPGFLQAVAGAGETGCDALIAVVSVGRLRQHREALESVGMPVLVLNAGTEIVRECEIGAPFAHLSPPLWQADCALGAFAASRLGGRGASIVSAYDAGYDTHLAFHAGVEMAGGGICNQFLVSGNGLDEWRSAFRTVLREQPDFVYVAASTVAAIRALEAGRLERRRDVPLLGTAFMAAPDVLAAAGGNAEGLITASPWPDASSSGETPLDLWYATGVDAGAAILAATERPLALTARYRTTGGA